MKKLLFVLSLLSLCSCSCINPNGTYNYNFSFTDAVINYFKVDEDYPVRSYKPSYRLVKRITYYNRPEEVIYQLGGFEELSYGGRIVASYETDNFIHVSCKVGNKINDFRMNYDDSIFLIDGKNFGLEGKHLFYKEAKGFTYYGIVRKYEVPEKTYVYKEIVEHEKRGY